MNVGWCAGVVCHDVGGRAQIIEPEAMRGSFVEGTKDQPACGLVHHDPDSNIRVEQATICGRVAGHLGNHWLCSPELIAQMGALQIVPR